jgi:hypothetical protein
LKPSTQHPAGAEHATPHTTLPELEEGRHRGRLAPSPYLERIKMEPTAVE